MWIDMALAETLFPGLRTSCYGFNYVINPDGSREIVTGQIAHALRVPERKVLSVVRRYLIGLAAK